MKTFNTSLLIKVAEAAGHHIKLGDIDPQGNAFELLAILKSKASDDGWYFEPLMSIDPGRYLISVRNLTWDENDWRSINKEFCKIGDPTNHISTANAEILCLAEVFGVDHGEG